MNQPPKVLLLGANGFIGRHIAFALRANGLTPLCVARNPTALSAMGFDCLDVDLTNTVCHAPTFWADLEVDYLINAAGLLTGSAQALDAVHIKVPRAIYEGLPQLKAGVLISATGIESDTAFSRIRRQMESIQTPFPQTILRPGLVLADTSYGGSSLMRALAAFPFFRPLVGSGPQATNPVHASDLAQLCIDCLHTPQPGAHDIGGPQVIEADPLTKLTRAWLGLPEVRSWRIPAYLARVTATVGDALRLGPISNAALAQTKGGVIAAPSTLSHDMRAVSEMFEQRPAGTQDLWHARLYLFRIVIRLGLAFMWLISGLLGLFTPPSNYAGIFDGWNISATVIGYVGKLFGIVDLIIALALLRACQLVPLAYFQIFIVASYTFGLSIADPDLWLDPLGGLLKNIPVILLILVHRILEEER